MESDPPEPSRATRPVSEPLLVFPGWRVRAAIYALLLIAFTAPISLDPGSRTFAQGPDTRLYLWTLGWDLHALKTDPLHIFNANIFFPETQTLAYSEHLIGASILALPLSLFTSNLYLILNFVLLLATFVTALGSDRLARECGASNRAALLAGIVGGFSGARLTRLTQAHLATLHFVPWTLAFAIRYLRDGHRRDLLLTLAFFTAQAITSGHGGLFLAIALGLFLILALALKRVSLMKLIKDCGIAGALILMINLPFVIPYYEVKGKVGLTRVIEDAEGYAPSIGSWIQAPTRVQTALTSAITPLRSAVTEANAALFPGLTMIGLATIASVIVMRRRNDLDRWPGLMVLALAVVTLWLSLGPSFGLYRVAYTLIPGFDLIRVPSRIFLLTLTALSTLAALGLDQIRRPKVQWALILIATLECIPMAWDSPRDPIATPPIDSWLATQPTPFRVVELPIPLPDNSVRQSRFQSEFMIHGAAHWQPMVNGYSSLVPPFHMDLYKDLYDFPTEKGLAALERIGVNYVIVHTDMYQPDRWSDKEAQIGAYGDRVRLLKVDGEGRAYGVGAAVAQPQ